MNLSWLSLTLLGIGAVITLVSAILLFILAFQKNPLWFLAKLVVPFAGLIFVIIHWSEAKSAFFGYVLGIALMGAGLATTPQFSDHFWKAYHAQMALHGAKSTPSEDLSIPIQQHRQQLESLQVTFAQNGVELTKQYQALDAQRKALKPGDTAAIAKFNEAAAVYQAKNAARKQMQAQIDSTQKELEALLDTRARHATSTASTSTSSNKKVVMYTTNHCPACEMARQYFVRNGVHYEENNVEANRTAYDEFRRLGGTGVPLILVGDQKIEGFDSHALDVALR